LIPTHQIMSTVQDTTHQEVSRALETIAQNGTILFPTDTIWGLGCDATNPEAIQKIREIKQIPSDEGMVVLVSSLEQLKSYVGNLHPRIETLLIYHSRPVTIIYEQPKGFPESLLHKDRTLAIRITRDPFCQDLIHKLGKPIVAAAACVKDEPLPAYFGAVRSDVIVGVDYVVRYRQKDRPLGEPSVIMKMNDDSELDAIRE
jgi:L-threonylcarbamoyladenylate synthase